MDCLGGLRKDNNIGCLIEKECYSDSSEVITSLYVSRMLNEPLDEVETVMREMEESQVMVKLDWFTCLKYLMARSNIAKKSKSKSSFKDDGASKKFCCRTWIWSGIIGALVVILFLILIAFVCPKFRVSVYYVNEDPSLMTNMLSYGCSEADSIEVSCAIQRESLMRRDLIEDLLQQKVIVSSDEFASNLSSYYNALIAVLAAVMIILNLIGYFSWRSTADNALEDKRREPDNTIKNIDESLEKSLEESFSRNYILRQLLDATIQNSIDQMEHLSDEEWDKVHLLLKKYEREETLKEIETEDQQENDGVITD